MSQVVFPPQTLCQLNDRLAGIAPGGSFRSLGFKELPYHPSAEMFIQLVFDKIFNWPDQKDKPAQAKLITRITILFPDSPREKIMKSLLFRIKMINQPVLTPFDEEAARHNKFIEEKPTEDRLGLAYEYNPAPRGVKATIRRVKTVGNFVFWEDRLLRLNHLLTAAETALGRHERLGEERLPGLTTCITLNQSHIFDLLLLSPDAPDTARLVLYLRLLALYKRAGGLCSSLVAADEFILDNARMLRRIEAFLQRLLQRDECQDPALSTNIRGVLHRIAGAFLCAYMKFRVRVPLQKYTTAIWEQDLTGVSAEERMSRGLLLACSAPYGYLATVHLPAAVEEPGQHEARCQLTKAYLAHRRQQEDFYRCFRMTKLPNLANFPSKERAAFAGLFMNTDPFSQKEYPSLPSELPPFHPDTLFQDDYRRFCKQTFNDLPPDDDDSKEFEVPSPYLSAVSSALADPQPSSKPSFPYLFDDRVLRWMAASPLSPLDAELFPDYAHLPLDSQAKNIYFHGFSALVDQYWDIGIEQAWPNMRTGHPDKQYLILAEIDLGDRKARGAIVYCVGQDNLCYHRYFQEMPLARILGFFGSNPFHETDFPELSAALQVLPSRSKPLYIDPAIPDSREENEVLGTITISDKRLGIGITLFRTRVLGN